MCRIARMRSVAMKRSAIIPTKNGEIIAASAVVPAARPICSPEKCSVDPSHVPIVTYHAPQTKYCKNMRMESFTRVEVGIMAGSKVQGAACHVRGTGAPCTLHPALVYVHHAST